LTTVVNTNSLGLIILTKQVGIIELAPVTLTQPVDVGGPLRVKGYRKGYLQMGMVIVRRRLANWKKYLDVAHPAKPADWNEEPARITGKLNEPGRMKVLQDMCKSDLADADAQPALPFLARTPARA
jgi:hypothetical protein